VDALYSHDAVSLECPEISRQTLQYLHKLPTRYSPLSLAASAFVALHWPPFTSLYVLGGGSAASVEGSRAAGRA
jgi:hypothetical protein